MHEFGMVDDFIHKLVETCNHGKKCRVIRVAYGPGLVEDSLRQAFQVHAAGTSLEKVQFEFIKKIVTLPCECGSILSQGAEEADMPYIVCGDCQHISRVPHFNVLELMGIDPSPPVGEDRGGG